jgi:hypothetical protein
VAGEGVGDDPEMNLDFSIARDDATGGARIFVSVSGMLIDTRRHTA